MPLQPRSARRLLFPSLANFSGTSTSNAVANSGTTWKEWFVASTAA